MQMLLHEGRAPNGTRLLSADSVKQMSRTQTGSVHVELQPTANEAVSKPFPLGAGRDTYGLGFQVTGSPGDPGMRSPGSLSWAGIFNTEFWIDPSRGICARADDAVPAVLRSRRDRHAARIRAARLRRPPALTHGATPRAIGYDARAMSAQTSESSVAGAAYGVLAALIWAGFPAITKLSMASHTLTAWDVTALRFATAGLLTLPLFVRHGLRPLHLSGALLLAVGAGAPYVLLTAGGLAFAPAAHMGVITPSCMLLVSTVGSWLLLGGKPTAGGIAGVLTILGGILMLGWDGLSSHGSNVWLGDAMFVLGGFLWASYTLATRAWGVPPLQATAVVAVISMLGYVPFYAAAAGSHLAAAPWKEIVIQAVFQGVLSAVVALVFYTRSVALLGAARGAVFGALVPSFALLFAIPILGEIPTRLQIVGVAVVTAGMLLVLDLYHPARWRRAPQALAVLCVLLASPAFAQRPSIPPQTIAGPALKVTVVAQRDAIAWPSGIEVDQLASVALDSRGHLFLLNRGKEAVLEFDARGAFVRSFGAGLFQRAHSLTFDARGHLWITDVVGARRARARCGRRGRAHARHGRQAG